MVGLTGRFAGNPPGWAVRDHLSPRSGMSLLITNLGMLSLGSFWRPCETRETARQGCGRVRWKWPLPAAQGILSSK